MGNSDIAGMDEMPDPVMPGTESDDFPKESMTADEAAALLAGNLVPPGEYVMQVVKVGWVEPGPGKFGGYKVQNKIITAPAAPPDGGWAPQTRTYRVFVNPTETEKVTARIDKQDMLRMMAACGVDVVKGVENIGDALKSCVGVKFAVTGSHRAGMQDDGTGKKVATGKKYQQWDNYKPIGN